MRSPWPLLAACLVVSQARCSRPARSRLASVLRLSGGASDDAGYYKTLGLRRDATPDEVKRAYRRAATRHHPDKGGDDEAFKKVGEAYSVLGDAQQRRSYDRFGKGGIGQQPPPPPSQGPTGDDARSAQHMFEQMFGGLGGAFGGAFGDSFGSSFFSANAGRQPRRFSMMVSLEDLYAGRTIVVAIGDRRARVRIEPGSGEGDVIRSTLGAETIVFELREAPHSVFARSRADLYVDASINLADALGASPRVSIRRLDGTMLRCALAPPGTVIRPGMLRVVDGEGMPLRGTTKKGRLFVRVSVAFPRGPIDLDSRQRESLRSLLRPSTLEPQPAEENCVTAREANTDEADATFPPSDQAPPDARASTAGSRRDSRTGSPLRFAFR
ncbi:hypothetical protein M885DRAFT_621380 [Pelagophyceae sp. CCMP2097]|nr:hypothetical protein M885DRAFT_621380 [Pelagophyceae sp. CCMP2097]